MRINGKKIDGTWVGKLPRYCLRFTDNGRLLLRIWDYWYYDSKSRAKKKYDELCSESDWSGPYWTDIDLIDRETGEIIAHFDAPEGE